MMAHRWSVAGARADGPSGAAGRGEPAAGQPGKNAESPRAVPVGVPWGMASQALNSGTNLLLSLLAGRLLGPAGLGVVAVAFATYLLCLGFHRALVTDPLVATSAASPPAERSAGARRAALLTLLGGLLTAMGLGLVSSVLPVPWSHAGLALAPWLPLLLLQDLSRSVLFRDGRPAAGFALDLLWLAGMGLSVPMALASRSVLGVLGVWGAGGALGGLVGWGLVGGSWDCGRGLIGWWRQELLPFGRWLAMEGIGYQVGMWTLTIVVAGILGARDLGGLRAVQSLFAPMSLIGPALALPSLPALVRTLERDPRAARRLGLTVSMVAAGATAGYVTVGVTFPDILVLVFGGSFQSFTRLILPIGLAQVLGSCALGATLLLKAGRHGRNLAWLSWAQVPLWLLVGGVAARQGLLVLSWAYVAVYAALLPLYARAAWKGSVRDARQGLR